MKVKQFRYSSDNFAYLVYGEREAAAVDGAFAKPKPKLRIRSPKKLANNQMSTHHLCERCAAEKGLDSAPDTSKDLIRACA